MITFNDAYVIALTCLFSINEGLEAETIEQARIIALNAVKTLESVK